MTYIVCHICEEQIPIELKEDHHVIPQAAGGELGPQKRLCNHCHDDLHKIAVLVINGSSGKVRDILNSLFNDNNPAQRRMLDLVNISVEELIKKKEGKISREKEPIVIMVSSEVKRIVQIIAKDTGRSMTRLTTDLVTEFVYKKYPNLRKTKGA